MRTRVVDRAASAAALLLSLGDERIAEPGAALVYHCFRVCSDAPVTATAAAVLFSDLADLDDRFLARLVDRALADADRVVTIAPGVDASDLPVLDRLTAALPAASKPRPRTARGLAQLLERAVRRAIRAKDRTALGAIYKALCRSEVAISPAVACLLRLVDHVGDPEPACASATGAPGLAIPHWAALYPPAGEVPRAILARHTLALGDTGSGKSVSTVLPFRASACACAFRGAVGCALLIDPKGEIGPIVQRDAPERLRRIAPSESGIDLMMGRDWCLADDIAEGALPHRGEPDRVARAVVRAFSADPRPRRSRAPVLDHQRGVLRPRGDVAAYRRASLRADGHRSARGAARAVVRRGRGHLCVGTGPARPRPWGSAPAVGTTPLRSQPTSSTRRSPSVVRRSTPTPIPIYDDPPWRFGTVVRVASSVWRNGQGEAPDVIDRVLRYWHPMRWPARAVRRDRRIGARRVRGDRPSPGSPVPSTSAASPAPQGRTQSGATSPARCRARRPGSCCSFSPRAAGSTPWVGKIVKGLFFEAVFNDPDRQRGGADTPIAAYVCDEFGRFVTSDPIHGEQSFLDTSRSFGVSCLLACQSIASIEHALAQRGGGGVQDRAAVSILWNNTGSKFFFRSTDPRTADRVDDGCPRVPGFAPVTHVRPLSSLAPGECYAMLAGRAIRAPSARPRPAGRA